MYQSAILREIKRVALATLFHLNHRFHRILWKCQHIYICHYPRVIFRIYKSRINSRHQLIDTVQFIFCHHPVGISIKPDFQFIIAHPTVSYIISTFHLPFYILGSRIYLFQGLRNITGRNKSIIIVIITCAERKGSHKQHYCPCAKLKSPHSYLLV